MALPALPLAKLAKLVIPIAAAAVGLGVGLFLFMGKQQEVNRLQQQQILANQQIADSEMQKEELKQQIGEFDLERAQFEDRMEALRAQISETAATLQQSQAAFDDLQGRYEELAAERDALQGRVADAAMEQEAAEEDTDRLVNQNRQLERAIRRSRQRLTLLDRDYQQLKDRFADNLADAQISARTSPSQIVASTGHAPAGRNVPAPTPRPDSSITNAVELPPIVVRQEQSGRGEVRGHLIEINEPLNFVVVDRGSDDGVRVGMRFQILRGSHAVGHATVVRVRPQLSACDVSRANTPGPLHVGDVAVQSEL